MVIDLAYLGGTVLLGLFSFFAVRILSIGRQVADLHLWHSKTDETGSFVWYERNREQLARTEHQIEDLKNSVATLCIKIDKVLDVVSQK